MFYFGYNYFEYSLYGLLYREVCGVDSEGWAFGGFEGRCYACEVLDFASACLGI
mgnify:CR=1 FL=1